MFASQTIAASTGEGNIGGVHEPEQHLEEAAIGVALTLEQIQELDSLVALQTQDELAWEHLQHGRVLEAQRLYLFAWDLRKRMLGSDHSDTLESLHNLADTYSRQGLWATAENLELQILSSRRRAPYKDNPAIINSLCNLACIYERIDQLLQAEHFAEQAFELSRHTFGETDTLSQDIGNFLAIIRSENPLTLTTSSGRGEDGTHDRSVNELETLVLESVARLQSRSVFDEEVEDVFKYLIDHHCANCTTRLDMSSFKEGPYAGGRFGDVWRGKLTDETRVAVKCLRTHVLKDHPPKDVKRAARELYCWSKAKHVHVLDLMGVAMFRGQLAMISPWMVNGTLEDYAQQKSGPDRWKLCVQVAEGLRYVHSTGMVHGDLKAKNILVSAEGLIKMSDFGNSLFVSECSLRFTDTTNVGGGTTRWMAPELLDDDDEDEEVNRSQPADVYALGMTVLEVVTGRKPYFECKRDPAVIKAVNRGQYPQRPAEFSNETHFGDERWMLLLKCWAQDPESRPKTTEVWNAMIRL
ncbi:hypothetical protein FRC07_005860 [Ceratobasidium sp. 392]|nr:hypothetical protein FRC07_005860 [Ceratobasidium sp. 392]